MATDTIVDTIVQYDVLVGAGAAMCRENKSEKIDRDGRWAQPMRFGAGRGELESVFTDTKQRYQCGYLYDVTLAHIYLE